MVMTGKHSLSAWSRWKQLPEVSAESISAFEGHLLRTALVNVDHSGSGRSSMVVPLSTMASPLKATLLPSSCTSSTCENACPVQQVTM